MGPDMTDLRALLSPVPVIPVITIERIEDAVPLARALVDGGLTVLEVTFRTSVAAEAIAAMATVSGAVVGAGTLLSADDVARAKAAGARFGVSPGSTPGLRAAVAAVGLPFLPGVATASEAMAVAEEGFTVAKLFPAAAVGGVALLKSLAAPLPKLRFCPTGGIDAASAPAYLALPNVICVGGSWMVAAADIKAGDFAGIAAKARAAAALRTPA
jgi:2-dehydro-3-deoxyphosphogluconate aldolase/(4S)-4-hydroxy-2-oxoglutarate aldolase